MAYLTSWLSKITDTVTGAVYDCTDSSGAAIQNIRTSLAWRNPAQEALSTDGGYDPDRPMKLSMRTFNVTIAKKYGGSIATQSDAWSELFSLAVSGNKMRFDFTEPDGTHRFWIGRIQQMDEQMATVNAGMAEIPFVIVCADPLSSSLAKPGLILSDSGLTADAGLFADVDPDNIPLTLTSTTHIIQNQDANAPDNGPIYIARGPISTFITTYNTSLPAQSGQYQYAAYAASIDAGETVTIDTGAGDVYSSKPGVDAYANFIYGSGQEYWLPIKMGDNNMVIVCGGVSAGARWSVDYRARRG